MAVGSDSASRARKIALLALLVPFPVLFAGSSAAAGRPALSARGDPTVVRITSKRVTGLYPGARRRLRLILANSQAHRAVRVRRIRVRSVGTSSRSCAATARNLTIRQYSGPPLLVPPGGRRAVSVRLTMPATVANGCQRAVFRLRYSAQTTLRGRRR